MMAQMPSTSRQTSTEPCRTNWQICCLCQMESGEKLICPCNVLGQHRSSGYQRLAANILKFSSLDSLPMNINLGRLDEGEGIEAILELNKASWHRSCHSNFNDLKLQRAVKRKSDQHLASTSPVKTRSTSGAVSKQAEKDTLCFFCDKSEGELHYVKTDKITLNVLECAEQLRDSKILAKLGLTPDMHAQDSMYNRKCLAAYYNRARNTKNQTKPESPQSSAESIALAELVSYIEEVKMEAEIAPVFKLSDLTTLYKCRLKQLGIQVPHRVYSTRLKERLLLQVPELHAYAEGREVLIAFEKDIGVVLHSANQKTDSDAMHLAKAAQIVRKQMLQKKQDFDGSLEPDCQKEAVSESLLALINMMLNGPNIKDQESAGAYSNASLAISQLLQFNVVKHGRYGLNSVRHSTDKETPLAIYLALLIHAQTRKRDLVDKLSRLGLCISYDRVLQISADMGNRVCAVYEEEKVVCPPKLKNGLFTTGNVDNIDHNPSARTAKDSFHGTAITLTQHPTHDSLGTDRDVIVTGSSIPKQKAVRDLPESYSSILPLAINTKDFHAPVIYGPVKPQANLITAAKESEYEWLERVRELLLKETLKKEDYLSWSAYYAALQPPYTRPQAITALLPMFHEKAHSAAMILHSMKIIKDAAQHLNPGQTPVIAMDQPLFAPGKQIQWCLPESYGEEKYVVMMGGLHIEMGALKMIGDWLANSGWTSALVQADITTTGKADAMLKAAHVTRTRYAHQVTACALYVLQKNAYMRFASSENSEQPPIDFNTWCNKQSEAHPQFKYWSTTLELELLTMEYIRSIREGNFPMYIQTLGQLTPWMFALDHHLYARWLPIHIRDMVALKETHPHLYVEFQQGKFVVQKSKHVFSLIALDQNHEQGNESVKGDGGAIGLTEDPAALRRDTIPKNRIPLFGSPPKPKSKVQTQITSLKSDCNLFSRLYIACQVRDGNLEEFFKHENQHAPPSLSSMGKLRAGQKSGLLQCLEYETVVQPPELDAKVLDGAAVVNMLSPKLCKTFDDYAVTVFLPYIKSQAQNVNRLDVVWDRYLTNSLKQCTRNRRGQGVRKRVVGNAIIPGNWQSFLRIDENKTELFAFLADQMAILQLEDKELLSTYEEDVISSTPLNKSGIAPCNHEEADTRMFLHVAHAALEGHSRVCIRTVDTDVVVLAIANAHKIQNVTELWIAFGTGKNFRFIPTHTIASQLGKVLCNALPFFHALTGCDTVSAFAGIGKKSAYEAWKAFPIVSAAFVSLSSMPQAISADDCALIERFVVVMYSRTCPFSEVNNARESLFALSNRILDNIPPTQAALQQHVKRAVYQAGHVWAQTSIAHQVLPSPASWGWQNVGDGWVPLWSLLPEAAKVCQELINCRCKKACRGLSKCYKANLSCTALCLCAGNCQQPTN